MLNDTHLESIFTVQRQLNMHTYRYNFMHGHAQFLLFRTSSTHNFRKFILFAQNNKTMLLYFFQVKKKLPSNCIAKEFVNWNMVLQWIVGVAEEKCGKEHNAYTTKCKQTYQWLEIAYIFWVSAFFYLVILEFSLLRMNKLHSVVRITQV